MQVGLEVLRVCDRLPRKPGSDAIARQLVRSATSIGANYRASCRAKSLRDILYKLGVVEEETDETLYWLDLLMQGGYADATLVAPIRDEVDQILAMTVASRRTLRARLSHDREAPPESKDRRIAGSKNRPHVAS